MIGKLTILAVVFICVLSAQQIGVSQSPSPSPTPSPSPIFSLSVSPYAGGYELDFGKIDLSGGPVRREVTISVNSNLNTQYEVSNSMSSSLCNDKGDCLPSGNFTVYGIRGSCKYGTIRQEREYSIGGILYTSNAAGTSDSFTAVYSVIPFVGMKPGYYRGTVGFTLTPIGSTQQPVRKTLDVIAQVEAGEAFDVEINGESGTEILLASNKAEMQAYDVTVNIVGNYGEQFRISQEPTQAAVSSEGKWLDWEAVKVAGSGSQKGTAISGPTALSFPKQLIYTSSPRGDADSFTLEYSLGDLSGQAAGIYKTNIRYYLENVGTGVRGLLATLGLNVEIANILDFTITPDDPLGIVFSDLKPGQPAIISTVTVEVKSSSGKRYQLTERLASDLTNKQGDIIPEQHFGMRTESLSTKGTLRFPQFDIVRKGDTVLFTSDNSGSPDQFKIMYGLTVPDDVRAGEYTTRITYMLSEI